MQEDSGYGLKERCSSTIRAMGRRETFPRGRRAPELETKRGFLYGNLSG